MLLPGCRVRMNVPGVVEAPGAIVIAPLAGGGGVDLTRAAPTRFERLGDRCRRRFGRAADTMNRDRWRALPKRPTSMPRTAAR